MSAHDCKQWTPGCFRCDLNLDELDDGQLRESLRIALAAVAALRLQAETNVPPGYHHVHHCPAERDLSALREECEMLRGTYQNLNELWGGAATRCAERAEKAERELAEARAHLVDAERVRKEWQTAAEDFDRDAQDARALLARWDAWFNLDPEEDNTQSIGTATRAFLRRDEARWEPSDNVFTHDEEKP